MSPQSVPVVGAIYTAPPLVPILKELFPQLLPGVALVNIMDDSLIAEAIRENGPTPAIHARIKGYCEAARIAGANVIFNTCSSVGEVFDSLREGIDLPVIKIDEPMAATAVGSAERVAVLATLPTTLGPTVRLVQSKAKQVGKKVLVEEGLAEGAFQALVGGDSNRHDRIILETAKGLADKTEIFVLAQGSMARMQETLEKETGKQVLTSTKSGLLGLKQFLTEMGYDI